MKNKQTGIMPETGEQNPKKEWVETSPKRAFLKSSLLEVMEGEFIQEYPWRCRDETSKIAPKKN